MKLNLMHQWVKAISVLTLMLSRSRVELDLLLTSSSYRTDGCIQGSILRWTNWNRSAAGEWTVTDFWVLLPFEGLFPAITHKPWHIIQQHHESCIHSVSLTDNMPQHDLQGHVPPDGCVSAAGLLDTEHGVCPLPHQHIFRMLKKAV